MSLFPLLEPMLANAALPLGNLLAFVDVAFNSPSWHICRSSVQLPLDLHTVSAFESQMNHPVKINLLLKYKWYG